MFKYCFGWLKGGGRLCEIALACVLEHWNMGFYANWFWNGSKNEAMRTGKAERYNDYL